MTRETGGEGYITMRGYCKVCTFSPTGHAERMQNQALPKQIKAALLEGKGKDEDHVKDGKMKLKVI
jgi:hypothetical protein